MSKYRIKRDGILELYLCVLALTMVKSNQSQLIYKETIMFTFDKARPYEAGIPSKAIAETLRVLDDKGIPMHSLLIMRKDKLVFEKYYAPYKANTLHRLFSIAKTVTALSVFALISEGKISINDHICDYFPEYVDESTHPWIKALTIENMLMMRTCHASCTYKADVNSDWVQSFFTTKPTHKPGTVFHYDTSAAHVLCALVEKLTGMDMLDYLKDRVLNYLDFSDESYMIKDPFGVSIGGSGLMATPMDFLKLAYLIDKKGTVCCNDGVTRELIPADLLSLATSNLSDTCVPALISAESQGYGMQIWQNEVGGFMLYGMGGQLGFSVPGKDLLIVTTADTQGIQGGNQIICNALFEVLLPSIDSEDFGGMGEYNELTKYADSLRIAPPRLPANYSLTGTDKVSRNPIKAGTYTYVLEENRTGFDVLEVILKDEGESSLVFINEDAQITLHFCVNGMADGIFPRYGIPCTTGAVWLRDNVLYIRSHIIGECVGSVHFELYFDDGDITVFMRKIEETKFKEFEGHLYGREK